MDCTKLFFSSYPCSLTAIFLSQESTEFDMAVEPSPHFPGSCSEPQAPQ